MSTELENAGHTSARERKPAHQSERLHAGKLGFAFACGISRRCWPLTHLAGRWPIAVQEKQHISRNWPLSTT